MRNLLTKRKISTEIFFGKSKKKISKKFSRFFFQKIFFVQIFFFNQTFFGNIFSIFIFTILRGAEGERSEPPAGGLAVGGEGSVNSEFLKKEK